MKNAQVCLDNIKEKLSQEEYDKTLDLVKRYAKSIACDALAMACVGLPAKNQASILRIKIDTP